MSDRRARLIRRQVASARLERKAREVPVTARPDLHGVRDRLLDRARLARKKGGHA